MQGANTTGYGEAKSSVACFGCREQKVKCTRELPSCGRCRKQSLTCGYPPPPDRKRIARETRARLSAANGDRTAGTANTPGISEASTTLVPGSNSSSSATKKQRLAGDDAAFHRDTQETDGEEAADLPPPEIGSLLLEIYFSRVYNSTLLLHKKVATELYARDAVPNYLLRAIFAQAAVFFANVDSPHKQYIKTYPIHTIHVKAWPWARAASREVLSMVDEPTLSKIQALQILQLYYFSRGDYQRATVHASFAYQLSQVLGYDRLYDDNGLFYHLSRSMCFDHEMKRRSFWASWCTICVAFPTCALLAGSENVKHLPLPAAIDKGDSVRGIDFKLGATMDNIFSDHNSTGAEECSLMAVMVKLLDIWVKVQDFSTGCKTRSHIDCETQLAAIVKRLDLIGAAMKLPVSDLRSQAEHYDETAELFASVCSFYHFCRLLLHASVAPLFSGQPAENETPTDWMYNNTKNVVQEAVHLANLFEQYLTKGFDVTRLWPYSGYAAFVAAKVLLLYQDYMPSLSQTNRCPRVVAPDSNEFKSLQIILDILSIYWIPLAEWAAKLHEVLSIGSWQGCESIIPYTYLRYTARQSHHENTPDLHALRNLHEAENTASQLEYPHVTSQDREHISDFQTLQRPQHDAQRTEPVESTPYDVRLMLDM